MSRANSPDELPRQLISACAHSTSHHSIACILPPYILRSIRLNGTPEQRRSALRTLVADASIRTKRAALGPTRPGMRTMAIVGPAPTPNRTIFDVHNGNESALPGDPVRAENQPESKDPVVNQAFDALGKTFSFYWQVFQRNSIDGNGLPLDATVHFMSNYDNAFWNGEQMVFGDGDGTIFTGFTSAIDVVGHELTHGVTQYSGGLNYHDQPGALNESISDVFGSLVKQFALGQSADKADWLIGAGILGPTIQGKALRSMAAPGTAFDDPTLGKDPQPATMSAYVSDPGDNGGVHINSGIPNHAFYLVATTIGGNAWEAPGRIWYETLTGGQLDPETDFAQFAARTIAKAGDIFGADSAQQQAVINAWKAVEVDAQAAGATALAGGHRKARTHAAPRVPASVGSVKK